MLSVQIDRPEEKATLSQIEKMCIHYRPNARPFELTQERREMYVDAVIYAAETLLSWNQRTIFLPRRGGALHGHDIVDAACMIKRKNGEYYNPHVIEVEASGIKQDKRVGIGLKESLLWRKEKAEKEKVEWPDMLEEFRISYDEFTLIDSADMG